DQALSRIVGEGKRINRLAQELPQSFIVSEEEQFVAHDRPANGSSKLISPEGRNFRTVKEIPRVHRAVSKELERGSMQVVAARFADRIDDTAGASSVLGGVCIRQDGKFANRIDAHVHSQGATRAVIGLVIHDKAVHTKDVLARAAAGYGHLRPKAFAWRGFLEHRIYSKYSGLQCSQLYPVAPIDRQLANDGVGDKPRQ